jgi:heme o synthase
MVKTYYALTKPGIIYGNALNAVAAFFLASRGHIDVVLGIAAIVGLSLIVACGCVLNNIIDRDIDALMERTKKRAIVRGEVSVQSAGIYAFFLGITGAGALLFTNLLTLAVALFGLFAYVCLYSLWSKRYTIHSTLIGAISGAIPPVVGYCAVTNSLDLGALILFVILGLWQLPHAWAIAVYRFSDYKAASVPVLPVAHGMYVTKIYMAISSALLLPALGALTFFGYTGNTYLVIMIEIGTAWLVLSLYGFKTMDETKWGRRMFLASLIMILAFCIMISLDWSR